MMQASTASRTTEPTIIPTMTGHLLRQLISIMPDHAQMGKGGRASLRKNSLAVRFGHTFIPARKGVWNRLEITRGTSSP